jgi:hypothetical protein
MKKLFILSLVFVLVLGLVGFTNVLGADSVYIAQSGGGFGSENFDYSGSNSKISPQYNTSDDDTSLELPNPVKDKTIMGVVNRLLGYLLIFSLPIAVFFIMLAGYNMIVSQGDKSKITRAWEMIKNVLIGLFIIFLSKTVVWLVVNILSGDF